MKTEYDLSIMKHKGHPLREKVSRGELKLITPFDIPDKESKLAKLTQDEREFVMELLESDYLRSRESSTRVGRQEVGVVGNEKPATP